MLPPAQPLQPLGETPKFQPDPEMVVQGARPPVAGPVLSGSTGIQTGVHEHFRSRAQQAMGSGADALINQFLRDMFSEDLESAGPVGIAMVRTRKVSYPLVHSGMPVILELGLSSLSGREIGPVKMSLEIPGYSFPWENTLGTVGGQAKYQSDIRLSFAPDRLSRLKEADTGGQLNLKLFVQGREVFAKSYPTEILACNQWAFPFPHASSCFVMPNDEALIAIFDAAKALLARSTGSPSFEGYQAGPKRADQIATALHDALIALGITYINPPASFEHLGQKVRLPRDIMAAKMGTCLDLAYLNCSMLERAGLHPVLYMVKGHAFYGYWREPMSIREGATTDLAGLLQLIEAGKLVSVNSTTFTSGGRFEKAKQDSAHYMTPEMFMIMVDIAGARAKGIRPLPY
jgi:hypothetical protein